MNMKTTLEQQKCRLEQEVDEALAQIKLIKAQPCPDFKILNYYSDLVVRDRQLIEMLDAHIFGRTQQAEHF